jgi:hypothetical protein
MPKEPLKVGDRVAAYAGHDRRVGKIAYIHKDGWLSFENPYEEPMVAFAMYSPKQCRRLIKKERKRIWVCFQPRGPHSSLPRSTPCCTWCREFVELRKAKK